MGGRPLRRAAQQRPPRRALQHLPSKLRHAGPGFIRGLRSPNVNRTRSESVLATDEWDATGGAGTGLSGVSLTRHRQTPNTAVRCRGPEPGATTRLRCRSGLRTILRDPTRESTFRLVNEGADCTFKLGKVAPR